MNQRQIPDTHAKPEELKDVSKDPIPRASEEVLKSRKIFTLKKREQDENQPKPTTRGFIFTTDDLVKVKKTDDDEDTHKRVDIKLDATKVNTSLFFNNTKQEPEKSDKKEVEQQKEEAINKAEPAKDETESKKVEPKEEESQKEEPKKEEPAQKTSLFGNTGGSLFGNKANSLFSQPNKPLFPNTGSLFPNTKPLFSNEDKGAFGLVKYDEQSIFKNNAENANKGTSIFANVSNNFFSKGNQQEDEEEEDAEPQYEDIKPEEHNDPDVDVLSMKNCRIFKTGDNEPFNLGTISLSKMKKMNDLCMLIFRDKMKKILHKSMVIPKVSKTCYMKNKKNAITVSTFSLNKADDTAKEGEETDKEQKSTSKVVYAKIGFISESDAAEFKEKLEEVIEGN